MAPLTHWPAAAPPPIPGRGRTTFMDTLLVRVPLIIKLGRPPLPHGGLNSLFQVALYLPFCHNGQARVTQCEDWVLDGPASGKKGSKGMN